MNRELRSRSVSGAAAIIDQAWNILSEAKCLVTAAEVGTADNEQLARLNSDLNKVAEACTSIIGPAGNSGFKRCEHCGAIFIGGKKKIYCNDRHCHSSVSYRKFLDKMNSEEALKIYNRAYRTRHARIKNGIITEDEFRNWQKTARNKLNMVRSGDLSLGDFEDWLESDRIVRRRHQVNTTKEVKDHE